MKISYDATSRKKEKRYGVKDEAYTDRNNLPGVLGYTGERLATGAAGVFEGIANLGDMTYTRITRGADAAAAKATDSAVGEWKQDIEERYRPGKVTSFLGDIAEGVGQSSTFYLNAVVPGLGTGLFFTGVVGNSVASASQQTGTLGAKEYAYGITVGAAEAALEKISSMALYGTPNNINGIGTTAGTTGGLVGALSKISLGKAATGRAVRNGVGKQILLEGASEFIEEFLGDYVDITAQRAWGVNKDAQYSLSQALYSGLVGFASGATMSGMTTVGQTVAATNSGRRVQQNGNVDVLLKQAQTVADSFGTMRKGALNQQMNEYVAGVQANYDAYNSLTEEQKQGARGALYLGEIEASMAGLQTTRGVESSMEYISDHAQEFADYATKLRDGKTFTADDIINNKDNMLQTLAILRWAGEFMTPSANQQKQTAVADALDAQATAVDIAESENWGGEEETYHIPATNTYVTVSGNEDGTYTITTGTREAYRNNTAKSIEVEAEEVEGRLQALRDLQKTPVFEELSKNATVTEDGEIIGQEASTVESAQEDSETENASEEQKKSPIQRAKDYLRRTKGESVSEETAAQRKALAEAQDRARRAVRDYDLLPIEQRNAIDECYRSAKEAHADMKLADATAAILSLTDNLSVQFTEQVVTEQGTLANGMTYEEDGRRIVMISAKSDAKGGASATLMHELTHTLEKTQNYQAMAELAVSQMSDERKAEIESMYRDYYGDELTDEILNQEITAEAIAEMINRGQFLKEIQNNSRLVAMGQRIVNLKNLLSKKNRDAFIAARRIELNILKCLREDAFQQHLLSTKGAMMEDGAAEDGAIKYNLATWEASGRANLEKYLKENSGLSADDQKAMLAQMDEFARKALENRGQVDSFDAWQDAKILFRSNHDGTTEPVLQVIVKNGDYKMNIDFSTVCKKRRMLNNVLNNLARDAEVTGKLATLSQEDVTNINNIIKKNGFEVACKLCFVDAKRYLIGDWAKDFANRYNKVLGKITNETVTEEFNFRKSNGNESRTGETNITINEDALNDFLDSNAKDTEKKIARYIAKYTNARRKLNAWDMIASDGLTNIKAFSPELFSILLGNYGSGTPKVATGDTPYASEILGSKIFSANEAYAVGGVRIQSFSDYVANMVFDYVQVFGDIAAKQLPVHTYTKEMTYAKLFGLTGAKINLSLVPKVVMSEKAQAIWDEKAAEIAKIENKTEFRKAIKSLTSRAVIKGEMKTAGLIWTNATGDGDVNNVDNYDYAWADESIDYDQAIELRSTKGYDKYVGSIAVGVSDMHILKLLRDPKIDMVIPYHKSGINPVVAALNGISAFNDYTRFQNTRVRNAKGNLANAKKDDLKKALPLPGMETDRYTYDWYDSLDRTGDPRKAAQEYLDWCDINGFTPKFDQFRKEENYYKLLTDFRVYDLDGNYTQQEAVKFDKDHVPEDFWKIAFEEVEYQGKVGTSQERRLYKEGMMDQIKGVILKKQYQLSADAKAAKAKEAEDIAKLEASLIKKYGTDAQEIKSYANTLLEGYESKIGGEHIQSIKAKILRLATLIGFTNTSDTNREENVSRIQKTADELAETIVRGKIKMDDDVRAIRTHLRGTKIKIDPDMKGDLDIVGGYNSFRKKNMGVLTLSNDGTSVDKVYMELNEQFGDGAFPMSVTNQADQIIRIAEQCIDTSFENYSDFEDEVTDTSSKIVEDITNVMQNAMQNNAGYEKGYRAGKVAGVQEAVGRYGKHYTRTDANQIFNAMNTMIRTWAIKNGYAVSMRSNYRESYLVSRIYNMLNTSNKYNAAENMGIITDNFLNEIFLQKNGERLYASDIENNESFRDIRKDITNGVARLHDTLGTATATSKLKSELSAERVENAERVRALKRTNSLQKKIDRILELTKRQKAQNDMIDVPEIDAVITLFSKVMRNGNVNIENVRQFASIFTETYLNGTEDSAGVSLHMQTAISPDVQQSIRELITYDNDNGLTTHMIDTLGKVATELENAYKTYGKVKIDGEWTDAKPLAQKGVDQAAESVNINKTDGFKEKTRRFMRQFFMNAVDPLRMSEMLEGYCENGVLSKLVYDVVVADTQRVALKKQWLSEMEEFLNSDDHKGFKKRLSSQMIHVESLGVDITVGQAMTYYMTTKREQAHKGLAESDVIFQDGEHLKKVVKGGNQRWADLDLDEKMALVTNGASELYKEFTEEDKEFIMLAEKFFNETSSEEKRKADKEYYGHELPMEPYYIPIQRDKSGIAQNVTDMTKQLSNIATYSNQSFNKATVKGASKPLYIRSLWDVVADHADGLSNYVAMYRPLTNFNTVWNAQLSEIKGSNLNMRTEFDNNVWDGSSKYFSKLFNDLQGVGKQSDPLTKIFNFARSAQVISTFALNPKIIVTQLTSLIACMDTIDITYYAKGMSDAFSNLKNEEWEAQMDQYSLYARARDYNTEAVVAAGATQQIADFASKGTAGIGYTDRLVVKMLWGCAQEQIAAQKGYAIGTEENLVEAGKLLDKAIMRNQQTAGSGTRSAFMRGGEVLKSLTMFSSDSMKQLSSLTEAVGYYARAKADEKNGVAGAKQRAERYKKQVARSTGAVIGVAIMCAVIAQAFRHLYRKDDEDKSELQAISEESIANMVGILPIVRDVYSLVVDGYELNEYSLDAINTNVTAVTTLMGDMGNAIVGKRVKDEKLAYDIKNALQGLGSFVGIPVRNINNWVIAVTNVSTEAAWGYDSIFKEPKYRKDLQDAVDAGNDSLAALIINSYMKKQGASADDSDLKALLDLYKGGYDILPTKIPTSVTVGDESHTVTAKDYKRFERAMSEAEDRVSKMIKTKEWQSLPDDAKAKAVKQMYTNAMDVVKNELYGKGLSKKAALSMISDETTVALLGAYASSVTEIVDGDKKITKKEQIGEYISGMDGDEAVLSAIAGYKYDGQEEVLRNLAKKYAKGEESYKAICSALKIDP